MKVLMAMSGGIDSSVAACLLKEQGHEVIGVHFSLWMDPRAPAIASVLPTKCCTIQSRMRLRAVAKHLKIPLHVVPLKRDFKKTVVDPYLAETEAGRTPNPCVLCNKNCKFFHLLAFARKMQCSTIATGHYARIIRRRTKDGKTYSALCEAKDRIKDQSYFLSRLTQEELARTMLPLGNFTKEEVFSLAKGYSIPLSKESYRESQDLCFFPEKSPDAFLRRYIPLSPGPITLTDGTIIGSHDGIAFSTIGQRHGLKTGGHADPLFVVGKEQKSNTIIMAGDRDLLSSVVYFYHISFTRRISQSDLRKKLSARIRARGDKRPGTLSVKGTKGTFRFARPMRAATPGQALVLYRGNEVIGSGIITRSGSPFRCP